jgi:hypothetical protein
VDRFLETWDEGFKDTEEIEESDEVEEASNEDDI